MITLDDARADRGILAVARVDPSTQEFTDKVNEACRRLMRYGDWWATVKKIAFVSYSNSIVWPRWVGTPLSLSEHHGAIPIRNGWYDFLPLDDRDWTYIGYAYHHHHHHLMAGTVSITDIGTTPVISNITTGSANYVLAYPRNAADVGRTLTLFGTDGSGYEQHEVLVLTSPFVASALTYGEVTRVLKDITADYVGLYQATDALATGASLMGLYAPAETRPEYRTSRVHGNHPHDDTTTQRQYKAIVKMQHANAISGYDMLSVSNIDAIKLMILSVEKEEAADPQGAEAEKARAIHELNQELNDKLPEFQIPIDHEPFGGMNMYRHSAF